MNNFESETFFSNRNNNKSPEVESLSESKEKIIEDFFEKEKGEVQQIMDSLLNEEEKAFFEQKKFFIKEIL